MQFRTRDKAIPTRMRRTRHAGAGCRHQCGNIQQTTATQHASAASGPNQTYHFLPAISIALRLLPGCRIFDGV